MPFPAKARLWVAVGLVSFVIAAVPAPHRAVQMSTEDRLQLPGWWPTKGTAAREDFVGPEACETCHATKARTQKLTPMAHAASPAADSEALRRHQQMTFRLPPYTYQIERKEDGSAYSVTDGERTISVPVGWAFGLGESGQTYVLEHNGSFYESRVSFFRALDGLDLTPTPSRAASSTLEGALGRPMLYGGETQRCFGCHTTASTTNNKFDPTHMIPGVTCEACHGPGAKHVAAMKAGRIRQGLNEVLDPGQLDPVDLVDFCGACHRSSVDVVLSKTYGILNLRFQPYRLQRSQCWLQSGGGVSCLACHNPHQPRARDIASYDDRCLACHSSAAAAGARKPLRKVCAVATKECVSCHMPKYEVPGMHFKFTDHLIRVVRKDEPYFD